MYMKITRYKTGAKGTFGELIVDGKKKYYTVEKPDAGNVPYISNIPAGKYTLIPHASPSRGDLLCLVNKDLGVTHYKEDVHNNRFAILIHVANYASNVEGCIGLGTGKTDIMVTNSKVAIKSFYGIVSPYEEHELEILEDY